MKMPKPLYVTLAVITVLAVVLSVIFVAFQNGSDNIIEDFDGDGESNEVDLDDDDDGVPDEIEDELGTNSLESNDSVHGTLIYDPTGSNYKSKGTDEAYLVVKNVDGQYESKPIELSNNYDMSEPIVMEAYFQLENEDTIITHIETNLTEDNEIENADLTLTDAIAGCFFNHTAGYGMNGNSEIFFISLVKAPALYTTISLSGVFIDVNELMDLAILDMDIPDEISKVIDSFDIQDTLGTRILLAGSISYNNLDTVSGDVLDIITPEDVSDLADILPYDLSEQELTEVTNFLYFIDMHLLTFKEQESNIKQLDLWFIIVPGDYSPGAYDGLVTLSVSESHLPSLFSDSLPSIPSWLELHVGTSNSEGVQPSYVQMSIMDLWDSLDGATQVVSVSSYGLIVSADDVIQILGSAFGSDISSFQDLTRFRDPAFAILVDYNITNYFDLSYSLKEYTALAFIPDVSSDLGAFARLSCPGVLYDLGDLLDMDFDYPVIFCDYMLRDTSNTVQTTLSSIYNDPLNKVNENFITHIKTSGRLLGVSLKSVAKYTQFVDPTGASQLMLLSPLDFGVYDLNDPDSGINYHLATIYPRLNSASNYYFMPANVEGYYLNLDYVRSFLSGDPEDLAREAGGSGGFGDGIFEGAVNKMFEYLGSNSRMLDGFLIADRITETSIAEEFTFLEVEHYIVEDEACIVPAVTGKVQYSGSVSTDIWVTSEIKAVDGTSTFLRCKLKKDGALFDGLDFIPFVNGNSGDFLISNGLKYLPAGVYDITIDITGWTPDSFHLGGERLGSYEYQIEITEDYQYDQSDPNSDYSSAISVFDGTIIRSLGYQNDETDWYSISLAQYDLLQVEYENIEDADVEVYLYYDPTGTEICSTDWSWNTVLQIVAQEAGTYYIKVVYDVPGIYILNIDSIAEDGNNDFITATDISLPEGCYYPDWEYWVQDGVTESDLSDYYKVYMKRGQYLYAWYENIGGANVEVYLYDSVYGSLDDTVWDIKDHVEGFALVDGWFYLKVERDTSDGFYNLRYYIRNGTPNLDRSTAIEVVDGQEVVGWLTGTPAGEMEHWYKIYVLTGQTIGVTDNGPVDMWLYAGMTEVDTTDLDPSFPDTVWDTSTADQWYYLVTRPGGTNEDYVLNFVFL